MDASSRVAKYSIEYKFYTIKREEECMSTNAYPLLESFILPRGFFVMTAPLRGN